MTRLRFYAAIAGCVFLFMLPVTHSVALRLLCLAWLTAITCYLWYRSPPPSVPLKLPLGLWVGWCWASLLWSIEPDYSFKELYNETGYTVLAFLAFYYLTNTVADWWRWQYALIAGLCFIATYALVQYFGHGTWDYAGRVGDRNAYSTYIIILMPFLLLFILQTGSSHYRKLLWLSLPLALGSGYFTLNRIMWPTLIAVTVVFFVLYFRKSGISKKLRILSALACAALCGLLTVQFYFASLAKSGTPEESLAQINRSFGEDLRPEIWAYARSRLAERPLIGRGYGRGILRKDFTKHFDSDLIWHGHNMFINYGLEAGLLGVAVITWLFASVGHEFLKLYRAQQRHARELGALGLSLLVGILIKTITDDVLVRENALLFWSMTGMILGLGKRLTADA